MKNIKFTKLPVCLFVLLLTVSFANAQRNGKPKMPPSKPKTIIFAVTNDGTSLEPIGEIDNGELKEASNGGGEPKDLAIFDSTYYKPKSAYKLIFGGAANGSVTVKSADPKAECGKNLAAVTVVSPKAKLKGLVMALATNASVGKASGVRRLPTAAERAEIETLVRDEFKKQGVSATAVKNLHYYNLTAVDVDNDGKAEMVGSYWVETGAKERSQLFFIADKNGGGKYGFGFSEYKAVKSEDVMSGNLKDLDSGTYAEVLLDTLEYSGDKTDEIFTITQGFEGNSFTVYSRKDGKWAKVYEGSNYHCAY